MTSFAYTPGTRCTRAASARDAVGRLRASGRSTRSARGHGGNTKREGRACRVRLRNADAAHAQVWQRPMWLRRPEYRATPQSVFAKVQGRNRRPRRVRQKPSGRAGARPSLCLPSWPVHSHPPSMDEAVRKPASKSSPCPRVLRVDRPEATQPIRATHPRSQQVATLPPSVECHSALGGPQCSASLHCIESFRSDSFVKRDGTLSGTACRS